MAEDTALVPSVNGLVAKDFAAVTSDDSLMARDSTLGTSVVSLVPEVFAPGTDVVSPMLGDFAPITDAGILVPRDASSKIDASNSMARDVALQPVPRSNNQGLCFFNQFCRSNHQRYRLDDDHRQSGRQSHYFDCRFQESGDWTFDTNIFGVEPA